jgi:hypothetical protein
MNWRRIDNMIISACIQRIQEEIDEGGSLRASGLVPPNNVAPADKAFEAWRVHLLDRMMEEYDRNHWEGDLSDPTTELEEDIQYYKILIERDKSKK